MASQSSTLLTCKVELNIVEMLCDSNETACESALEMWVTQKQTFSSALRDGYTAPKKNTISISCLTLLFSPPFIFPLLSYSHKKEMFSTHSSLQSDYIPERSALTELATHIASCLGLLHKHIYFN